MAIDTLLPDLVTKSDLAAAKAELEQAVERIEHRLTLRVIGVVGAFGAALFALLRFVHWHAEGLECCPAIDRGESVPSRRSRMARAEAGGGRVSAALS